MKTSKAPRNILLGIFLGIGIGFVIASVTVRPQTPQGSEQLSALLKATPKSITSTNDGISITVHNVRNDMEGSGPIIPAPGNHFAILDLTVENATESVLQLIPMMNLTLKDQDGKTYPAVAVPTDVNPVSGDIAPKDLVRQEIGFDVPNNTKWLRLYYEPTLPHKGIQVISLNSFLH